MCRKYLIIIMIAALGLALGGCYHEIDRGVTVEAIGDSDEIPVGQVPPDESPVPIEPEMEFNAIGKILYTALEDGAQVAGEIEFEYEDDALKSVTTKKAGYNEDLKFVRKRAFEYDENGKVVKISRYDPNEEGEEELYGTLSITYNKDGILQATESRRDYYVVGKKHTLVRKIDYEHIFEAAGGPITKFKGSGMPKSEVMLKPTQKPLIQSVKPPTMENIIEAPPLAGQYGDISIPSVPTFVPSFPFQDDDDDSGEYVSPFKERPPLPSPTSFPGNIGFNEEIDFNEDGLPVKIDRKISNEEILCNISYTNGKLKQLKTAAKSTSTFMSFFTSTDLSLSYTEEETAEGEGQEKGAEISPYPINVTDSFKFGFMNPQVESIEPKVSEGLLLGEEVISGDKKVETRSFEYNLLPSKPVMPPLHWIPSVMQHASTLYATEPEILFGKWMLVYTEIE